MAKAFNFSLEKVLDVRKTQENHKAVELGKAQVSLDHEKNKLKDLKTQKTDALKDAKKTHIEQKGLDLNRLRVNNDYVSQLSARIAGQEKTVNDSTGEVDLRRKDLIHAARDKKVVEMLKDRYLDQYKKMRNQEESKKEGEVAIRIQSNNQVGHKT